MKWKRRSKAYKVQSVDLELEELSKLNEGNVIRIMDRSEERSGEKISSEEGLFVPKRDPYEEMIRKRQLAGDDYEGTKVSSKTIRDDAYRYGKQFAVGEQYLEQFSYDQSSEEEEDWEYSEESIWSVEEELEEVEDEVEEKKVTKVAREAEENEALDAIMAMLQEQQAMEVQKLAKEQAMEVKSYNEEQEQLQKEVEQKQGEQKAEQLQKEASEEIDYDMVRPEILDEIGFTPGGNRDQEEKKAKKKKFGWFFKRQQKEEDEIDEQFVRQRMKEIAAEEATNKERKEQRIVQSAEKKSGNATVRESRAIMMHNAEDRKRYIRKNKEKLAKAKNDFARMQKDYGHLTECLNDMILLNELPDNVAAGVKRAAEQIIRYRKEQKSVSEINEMDRKQYLLMAENKQELPKTIRRLSEDEAYVARIKSEIDRLEGEKAGCQMEQDEVDERRRKTAGVSIAVIVAMIVTMGLLLTAQFMFDKNMQIPILLFGICIILVTLGICVQYFKTQTNETENNYMLNRIIKKQNREKAKYVTALNGVEYIYKKYDVHSSSELLYMWELYQKEYQARESFKNAETETRYYEDRLVRLLQEYGMKNPNIWLNQVEFLIEQYELEIMKEEMINKRNKLMKRMEKCKRFMGKVESELSVLLIKFPQYADEIKELLNE